MKNMFGKLVVLVVDKSTDHDKLYFDFDIFMFFLFCFVFFFCHNMNVKEVFFFRARAEKHIREFTKSTSIKKSIMF